MFIGVNNDNSEFILGGTAFRIILQANYGH